jgi:hypothetical protein
MSVELAAIAVLTIFCVVNLLLLVGVIRRLRDHESRQGAASAPRLSLPVGSRIAGFATVSSTGEAVTSDALGRRTAIGVFSPTCAPCHRQLPDFIEYARRSGDAFAVVMTDGGDHREMAARLEPVCPVVIEPQGGPVTAALNVIGTPVMLLVEDGVVIAAETVVSRLPGDLPADLAVSRP